MTEVKVEYLYEDMGYSTEEGWHVTEDGTRLYTKTWKVGDAPPLS